MTSENKKANRYPRSASPEATRLACTATGLSIETPVTLRPCDRSNSVSRLSSKMTEDKQTSPYDHYGSINNTSVDDVKS